MSTSPQEPQDLVSAVNALAGEVRGLRAYLVSKDVHRQPDSMVELMTFLDRFTKDA
jgi:hypothetical protein